MSISRGFAASAADAGAGAGAAGSGDGGQVNMSLEEALNKLVDAAVDLVQADRLRDAIRVLQEGVAAFEPTFPNTPELGELHNQVALLLFFEGNPAESAKHAQASLEITQRHFGTNSLLTGHRLLRLGAAKFGLGQVAEAAPLLRQAHAVLPADDPSRAEAGFYMDLSALTMVGDVQGVRELEGALLKNVRAMREMFGGDSMIVSMALVQHSRLVNGALDADFRVGEEMIQQHIRLLTEVNPSSEDVAVTTYKLATFYYAADLLGDGMTAIKRATDLLRAHYPDDHDVMVLCQHRMGMICAAQGDHRAAVRLLAISAAHYAKAGSGATHEPSTTTGMLAKEAAIGNAMAKFRAAEGAQKAAQKRAALADMRAKIDDMAGSIGKDHMLVNGANRFYVKLEGMAK